MVKEILPTLGKIILKVIEKCHINLFSSKSLKTKMYSIRYNINYAIDITIEFETKLKVIASEHLCLLLHET